MNPMLSFNACFEALTGYSPLRWQMRFFDLLISGEIPSACDLPTGFGKTSVIPIWLIALVSQDHGSVVQPLPRRLVYIVNRRTVVDQATEIVEGLHKRLRNREDDRWASHTKTLRALSGALQSLSASDHKDESLGVSTLRGELADNEEWKADPSRPAIIIGTIDMIGSKLLFSGYGDGRYRRAHHAGLIGHDVLIVHDEAHLTPAFSDLLRYVADVQRQAQEPRPAQVIELSATQRNGDDHDNVLRLESEDEKDKIAKDRLDAMKYLRFHEVEKNNFTTKLAELAKQHDQTQAKVLIYVQSPDNAQEVAGHLKKAIGETAGDRVAMLTGTIRGYERDRLVKENPVYRALLNHGSDVEHTVYLVSTSAGEVGIDLDADHMVCDLTTMDSLIQRLGRVNRCGGEKRKALVDVVASHDKLEEKETATEYGRAIQATYAVFQRWTKESDGKFNVTPRNLRNLLAQLSQEERLAVFSPKPDTLPLTDIMLDAWSLTSIGKMPGRMEIAAFLHGLTKDPKDPHETFVVWRKEVTVLDEAQVDDEVLSDWFSACRIETRERLRDSTDRVREALTALLKAHLKHRKDDPTDFSVVLLDERGSAEKSKLSVITKKDFDLAYRTVVLPIEAGGINEHGMLDANVIEPIDGIDVVETATRGIRRERLLHIYSEENERYEQFLSGKAVGAPPGGLSERYRVLLEQSSEGTGDGGDTIDLLLLASPGESALENPETARFRQTLASHTRSIVSHMECIAAKLKLEHSVRDALVMAAKYHDRGKDRLVWQRYACNPNGSEPLAKSKKYRHGLELGGYRHEFGSVLDSGECDELRSHPEFELIMHLLAAHHGYARPHFELSAVDNERFSTRANADAAADVMRRFGQLQQRFGRWGLVWLESLLRCADIAASKEAADETVPATNERKSQT